MDPAGGFKYNLPKDGCESEKSIHFCNVTTALMVSSVIFFSLKIELLIFHVNLFWN